MNASDGGRLTRLLAWSGAALLAGCGLLVLARWLERSWSGTLLAPVLLEEGLKGGLFLAMLAARRLDRRRLAGVPVADLLPLVAVMGFGAAENVLYFLASPTSSIYQRLLYAYPVHINTGLLYTLVCLSGKPVLLAAALPAASAYHLGLNALALSGPAAWTWVAGAGNLPVMLLLILRLQKVRVERSLEQCWKPV
jgi:hypothetical protein